MRSLFLGLFLAASATAARAQSLQAPEASPHASAQQTVGLTEITVDYHRPAVGGRPIWGQLVPYGEVWRTGANENTIVSFSTDVKVGGKPLRAGKYGLHAIPTAKDWTIIFSTVTTAWGSYTYDPKEDALRVTVTPRAQPVLEERLAYRFDDPSDTKVALTLAWEKLAVPIAIEVDTPKIVMANMRGELRGSLGFRGEPWTQAANYWLKNGGPLDEALRLIDRSIANAPTYGNLTTRADILEKQGKAAAAKEARAKAQPLATETDLFRSARGALRAKKTDEALAIVRGAEQKYPQSSGVKEILGDALAAKGDRAGALAAYEKALALAGDPVNKKRIEQVIRVFKKQG